MIDVIVYLMQLTVVASFSAITYWLGKRWLGRYAGRVLLAGISAVMLVTTLAWLPKYVLLDVPVAAPTPTATDHIAEASTAFGPVSSAGDRLPVQRLWLLGNSLFVFMIVIVGVVAVLRVVMTVASYFSMRRLIRSAEPISDKQLRVVVDEVVGSNESFKECRRISQVRFVKSEEVSTASTFGNRYPVILLPMHWRNWSEQEVSAVLAHEFEHIRQADFLLRLVTELVRALHFYHPLVGWIANQYRIEQENTADLAAAKYLGRELYERLLFTEGTKSAKAHRLRWVPSFSFESKSLLRRRIEMLRERLEKNEQMGSLLSLLVMACVIPLTLVLCGVHASAQQEEESHEKSAEVQEDDDAQNYKNGWTFEFKWGDDLDQGDEQPDADDGFRKSFQFFWVFPGDLPKDDGAEDSPWIWDTDLRFEWHFDGSGK